MCKVYNPVGSLTVIKSHLQEHNINEFKSVNELINFQKNFAFSRQLIVSNHERLIEQEKNTLLVEIAQLDHSVTAKKTEAEQKLLLSFGNLKHRLNNLASADSNLIPRFNNYVKKVILKLTITVNKFFFRIKVAYSLKHLISNHKKKSNRYKYIESHFDDAVNKSSLLQLEEIDERKRLIDQINNSLYGALGEQKVVRELEKLSDKHILINDFTCSFQPPIYNRREHDYIKSIQIDHILISPSGIFLIETKNWSQLSLDDLSLYSPIKQVKRTNFVLYKILNAGFFGRKLTLDNHHWGDRKIPIRNLIVFINHKPTEEFQNVKILTLTDLLGYVNYFKPCFSTDETQAIATYLLKFIRK